MFKYIIKKLKETRGDLGSLFGSGGNSVQNLATPTFQTDPNFTNSQNSLATLGQQVLGGNLPSFYSGLGKTNSPQFQSMLTNVEGQTNQQSQAAEAASGTARSGVGQAASAMALNNVIPGLNYQDLLNAQQQQQGLLGFGANVTQDVAGNALNNQSQENLFAQENFQNNFDMDRYNNAYSLMQGQQTGNLIGSLVGGGLGAGISGMSGGSPAQMLSGFAQGSGMGSFSNLLSGIGSTTDTISGVGSAMGGISTAGLGLGSGALSAMGGAAGLLAL